ncbi:MAG: hypothetical protein QXU92_03680 [Candidatus Diapherotrites archaeon]
MTKRAVPRKIRQGMHYTHGMTAAAIRTKVQMVKNPNSNKILQQKLEKLKGTQKAQATRIINNIKELTQTRGWEFNHSITHEVEILIFRLWEILKQNRKTK